MPSPDLVLVVLSTKERQVLEEWARRRTTVQALALRSRIVLACADGASNTGVAAALGVSRATVAKWRSRFLAARLQALSDLARPGAPRKITDEQVDLVITKTLRERGPGEDGHWSTRSMAAATGLSQTAISRIWRASGLKPHRCGPSRTRGESARHRRNANQGPVSPASARRVKFLVSGSRNVLKK